MTTAPLPDLPLSRPIAVDDIPSDGLTLTVRASEAERAALARLNGLVALASLEAPLRLRHEPGGGVGVTGTVEAAVTQTCVVSLEPFEARVQEPVDVHFLSPAGLESFRAARQRALAQDDPEEVDEPDLVEDGRIDVGALVAEHLTLGLDPYPRKPGATLPITVPEDDESTSPFAVLRRPRDEQP